MATPDSSPTSWFTTEGTAFPLGATWIPAERSYNFALYSRNATKVSLLLFKPEDCTHPAARVFLDPRFHKSGQIWHCRVPHARLNGAKYYGYVIDGPGREKTRHHHAYDLDKVLLDPYAKSVYFPPEFDRDAAMRPGSNMGRAPLGVLFVHEQPFDWSGDYVRFHEHDLVIYEMHIRGFTQNPNSGVAAERRGTFLGVIDKIPYLKQLGVTAVELLPVHQFDPQEGNYWGYMTMNFFAPHAQYATQPDGAHGEFRSMVKALHAAGIEVLMDVVFNHTAEGNEFGPTYSFKGIDNSTYYLVGQSPAQPYLNYSGTGNTLNCKDRYVGRMILDSLRSWAADCHVDGFRFDLASVFNRRPDGTVSLDDSRLVSAIRSDPVLGGVRLIAEPWDAAGLYQLGRAFPGKRWLQWNGKFRDEVRRFVRGDAGLVGRLMCRMYGSDDLFPDNLMEACHPYQSVNYVNSHDGFTLYDQVSYNDRHNWANGEDNRDGHKDNYSWNCGWEGDAGAPPKVLQLRRRQARNFCALLMLAAGTPMFCAGDEFLNTQGGNNNPYNQDNETSWLDWSRLKQNADFFRFFRLMIDFRKRHPTIARSRHYRGDIRWYGEGRDVDFSESSRHFAYFLNGASHREVDLYVMINADWRERTFELQEFGDGGWLRVMDTSGESPEDIFDPGSEPTLTTCEYLVSGRSIALFMRPRKNAPAGVRRSL